MNCSGSRQPRTGDGVDDARTTRGGRRARAQRRGAHAAGVINPKFARRGRGAACDGGAGAGCGLKQSRRLRVAADVHFPDLSPAAAGRRRWRRRHAGAAKDGDRHRRCSPCRASQVQARWSMAHCCVRGNGASAPPTSSPQPALALQSGVVQQPYWRWHRRLIDEHHIFASISQLYAEHLLLRVDPRLFQADGGHGAVQPPHASEAMKSSFVDIVSFV